MTKVLLLALGVWLLATTAAAQTVNADRFTLKAQTPNCTIRSGEGPPATTLDCDIVVDVKTGMVHVSGLGTSTAKAPPGAGAGDLLLAPQGDLVVNPGRGFDAALPNNVVPGATYKTQLGSLQRKFLTLHAAELWVETLVAQNTMATIGGRILVGPTNVLRTPLTAATPPAVNGDWYGTNWEYNNFTVNDLIYMESGGRFEVFKVMGGPYTGTEPVTGKTFYGYYLQRNQDGSGANDWYPGDAGFNTGQVGSGFIDLYSRRGSNGFGDGPTIVGQVRTGPGPVQWEPRWLVGNAQGLYGYREQDGPMYGAIFGPQYGARIEVFPKGLQIYDSNNGLRVNIDNLGNAAFTGTHAGDGSNVTNINGGYIKTGTVTADQIAAGAITTAKLSVGVGKNLVQNSECRAGTQGWNLHYNTVTVPTLGTSWLPWRLDDGTPNVCFIWAPGVQPENRVVIAYGSESSSTLDAQPGAIPAALPIQGEYYAVVPGKRYEASMYVGNHSFAYTQIYIFFERFVEPGSIPECPPSGPRCPQVIWTPGVTIPPGKIGGPSLDGYERGGFFATAPAGATRAKLYIQAITYAGQANQFMFFTRMYFGEATAGQTELSEWTPAGRTVIDGATIMTGSIRATHIAADQITTRELAANAVYADNITAGQITAGKLAANSVIASNIQADQISTRELSVNAVYAENITAGQITAGKLSADSVVAANIQADNIGAREIWGDRLDVISANMGNLTAGGIVVGNGSNYMWFNDTGAGDLAIGGWNKGGAPFYVRWDGGLWTRMAVLGEANTDVIIRARLDVGGTSQNSSTDIWNNVYIKKISGMGDVQVCADNDGRLKRCGTLLAGELAEDPVLGLRREVEALRQELALLRREHQP